MLDTHRLRGLITVIPGTTVAQFLHQIHAPKSFSLASLGIKPPIANPSNSLEGEIGLASYSFSPTQSIESKVKQAVHLFSTSSLPYSHAVGNFTAYQILTIASMLQIEGDPRDFSKVARTIYNRLKIHMPLQLNSTVQYASSTQGQLNIGSSITSINSPYNTYLNQGLPPTPISNPSIAAITAAENPARGNWLYFITIAPHDTRFTNSYAQFLQWKAIYEKNLNSGKFK
jgi:UPF0755 protein